MWHRFPSNNESAPQRFLVGTGVVVFHGLLLWYLLHAVGSMVAGAGDQIEGEGDGVAMVVEFIAVSPTTVETLKQLPPQLEPPKSDQEKATAQLVSPALEKVPEPPRVASEADENALNSSRSERVEQRVQSEDSSAAAAGGSAESDLVAAYHMALRARIVQMWHRRTDREFPSGCALRLSQSPGGAVTVTSASECDLSVEDRLQLEAAALMAQPLPYEGFEKVFSSEMWLQL